MGETAVEDAPDPVPEPLPLPLPDAVCAVANVPFVGDNDANAAVSALGKIAASPAAAAAPPPVATAPRLRLRLILDFRLELRLED